jgi:iron complex transport system ATP-binding protein
MKDKLLEINNLSIGYQSMGEEFAIQKKLELHMNRGELCCLIGPNGVGKSTLLKTISSQLAPLKGEILFQSHPLKDYNNIELAKRISIVLTEGISIPNLSVYELVSMGRFPYTNFWGKLKKKDCEIIDEAISLLSLENLKNRNFVELSDGEKQKTLIAKALAQQTPLILLDEPTAFLDFPTKMTILSELRKIAHLKKISIILSTHDLELALKMADVIWLLPQANNFKTGIPEDLVLAGEIGKAFSNAILHFDLETAHFVNRTESKDLLNVVGDGIELEWLKRALIRKGISGDTTKPLPLKVYFSKTDKRYFLKNENQNLGSFESIQDVLGAIEKQTIS